MAIATIKSPAINAFIGERYNIDRVETIHKDICVMCKKEANNFKDELSKKEYRISGMCQKCQNNIFG